MSTLGVFIDIEGAFDKAAFNSIGAALSGHGVEPTLCVWIQHMLKWRAVQITVGDVTVRGVVSKGCPQGGVLSPLLWNLVVDSLLQQLNNRGFFTIGYADDITVLLSGKFEGVLCNLMQTALNLIETWCTEHSLSVNPAKTELVLFTRKRKVGILRMPTLFGTTLALKEDVKYLGIIFDKTLSWKKQLKEKTEKACMVFWQCRRAIGKTWGFSPKVTLWLYTAIIRPMLTYGALVWWPRTELATTILQIRHVQRLVCLSVTGAMHTTPTAAMEAILCLPPLELFVKEVALRTALRLRTTGQWKIKSGGGKHICILEKAVVQIPLLESVVDRLPPTLKFNETFKVWLDATLTPTPNIAIFTDGSKSICGSGAGVFSDDLDLHLSIPLGEHATVFQAEIMGILQGATLALERNFSGKRIRVSSDSRAALLALSSFKICSGLVSECKQVLVKLSEQNIVDLAWTKAHSGDHGNEKADELARSASVKTPWGPEPIIPMSLSTRNNFVKQKTFDDHKQMWENLTSCRQARAAVPTLSKKIANHILQLSRGNVRLLVGIATGHCRLNKHMHTIGLVTSPTCRGCNLEDETAEHVFCHCPALAQTRRSVLGDSWPDMASFSKSSPSNTLNFVRKIGWLSGVEE